MTKYLDEKKLIKNIANTFPIGYDLEIIEFKKPFQEEFFEDKILPFELPKTVTIKRPLYLYLEPSILLKPTSVPFNNVKLKLLEIQELFQVEDTMYDKELLLQVLLL
jgi:hypothetical protein